jgi:hypothetical protein
VSNWQSKYTKTFTYNPLLWQRVSNFSKPRYSEYLQKNGAISKVINKFISHLTQAQRTPSAGATVQQF